MARRSAVVFGAEGFIGSYLVPYLEDAGFTTFAVSQHPIPARHRVRNAHYASACDVTDAPRVNAVLRRAHPSLVFHLAAMSSPTFSWKEPWTTMRANVLGTLNVLEAVRALVPRARVFVACSSAEYGHGHRRGTPTAETAPLLPLHPYGVSKVAQDLLSYQYFVNYGVRTIRGRIFNTIGPGKTGEVTSDIARQLVAIERGARPPVVRIGNLDATRDFTDVRDMVRAMVSVTQRGRAGAAYNLASGRPRSIREVLRLLIRLSGTNATWKVEKSRIRPTDEPYIVGDATRLRHATGWSPRIEFARTLSDILDAFRAVP